MGVQTAVSVIIGAELGSGFTGAFGNAQKQLGTLGNTIKKLDSASNQVNAFNKLKQTTLEAGGAWIKAKENLSQLQTKIKETSDPSKKLLLDFNKAEKQTKITAQAFSTQREALAKMGNELRSAGVDTNNLTSEQGKLGQALETLKKRQASLSTVQGMQKQNMAQRANYRSQMMDIVALGTSMYGLIKPAVAFESAMADVKKVVDFDSPEELRQMEADIKKLSKSIPLSLKGLADIVAAGGQLGVPKEQLTEFAETASKMSVAFDITADEAGQSMAKLSNVLQMPISEMSRVGDVINHISNNIAATASEIVEVNLRAGAMGRSFGLAYNEVSALAGTFVSLGKTPEIAATAINMMSSRLKLIPVSSGAAREAFDQLGISMKDYTKLVEDGNGKDALMMVLNALKDVQGIKRSKIMKDMFGEQATRHINSLVESLDTLKSNFELVGNETEYAGSMQKEFAARSATTENNIQLLKNQITVLTANIGNTLLPTINSVVGIFGKAANSLADFAEKHPTLIKYIGLAVAGLTSFKLASFAVGYGFTFLKGGVLAIMGIFTQARAVFSLVKLGLSGLIPIIKTVGMAFLTNPITLIITAIAAGAFLVIKYWEPISAFFKKLFEPVIAVFKQVWEWISNLWEKAKNIFNGIKEWVSDSWVGKAWNWVFGSKDEKPANDNKPPKIGESVSADSFLPANQNFVELPRSTISTSNQSAVSVNAPITINQSPGMSAEDVARQVSQELDSREQTASRRRRAVNYD